MYVPYLAGDLWTARVAKIRPCQAADGKLEVSSLQPFHHGYSMGTRVKLISARVGMRVLADELQTISRVCQLEGISRSHIYEIMTGFEKFVRDGLALAVHRRPGMLNVTPMELVQRITRDFPTYSYVLVS